MSDVKGREEVERTLIARGHVLLCSMTMPTPSDRTTIDQTDQTVFAIVSLNASVCPRPILEQSVTSKIRSRPKSIELTI